MAETGQGRTRKEGGFQEVSMLRGEEKNRHRWMVSVGRKERVVSSRRLVVSVASFRSQLHPFRREHTTSKSTEEGTEHR